jgi:hypothetical protein
MDLFEKRGMQHLYRTGRKQEVGMRRKKIEIEKECR